MKTLKTKKKLFEDSWSTFHVVLGFFILFIVLGFSLRSVTIPRNFGHVTIDIPVVSAPINDPGFHNFEDRPIESIQNSTPAVIMTAEAFFFGDLSSFSTGLDDSSNKFIIQHEEGVPQISRLAASMEEWLKSRAENKNIPLTTSIVMIPGGNIPVPILIQVISNLQKFGLFKHVVLSHGIK